MASSPRLITSLELIRRVSDIAAIYTVQRMRVLEQIPGNPIGIAFRKLDNVVGLMARHLPSPDFNSALGLQRGQAHHIRPLVEWYREHQVSGRFEIAAGDDEPALGQELARLGFFQSGYHAALIGEPNMNAPIPSEAVVEAITSSEQMEEFLSAYVAGWGIPENAHDQFKANVRPWLSQSGWSLYLARSAGHAAAAAILFIHDGVG